MLLTEYETTVVLRPDIGGDTIESTLDRVRGVVRDRGGKLLAINHWGKRKLGYPIAKHSRGIYVNTHYLGGSTMVAELERNLRIADSVLRYMTVKMDGAVDPTEREEKEYVRPQYDALEATHHGDDEAEAEAQEAKADDAETASEPAEAKADEAADAKASDEVEAGEDDKAAAGDEAESAAAAEDKE